MGGTSGCCVKNPNSDNKLDNAAQQHGYAIRTLSNNEEHEAILNEQRDRNNVTQNAEQNQQRHITNIPLTESAIVADNERGILRRESCEDETKYSVSSAKKRKPNYKKKRKKAKNKLISELRGCIMEFNASMKSISLLELMSTENAMNEYNQNELLDRAEICRYFKNKKYDIQWFLCTKRNKFIIIVVNKWPNISILTTIKIYNMLQEKIHKITPSVSKSALNLVTTLNSKSVTKRTNSNSSRKHQENIMFTWKDNVHDIDDCDVNHFLYIVSVVIKNANRERLQNNSLFKQSMMGVFQTLFNQFEILTYLLEIKMNGYLFRGITKDIFFLNIDKFVVNINSDKTVENEAEKLKREYCDNLYSKIDTFDISKIYKQSTCTIEFTLSNSKRWESVSSLVKNMPVDDWIDFEDEEDEDEEESESGSQDEEESDSSNNNHDFDEKQIILVATPQSKLQETRDITQSLMDLRSNKSNMSTDKYVEKMEMLQQKLADITLQDL